MPQILSVQNIQCETLGLLEQMFVHDGYHIEKVNAPNNAVPTNPLGYNAMKNDTPVLGICLGSQLIAQAAGGRVYKGKKKEIGWYDVYLTPASSNDIFRGFTDKMIRTFQWHGDTYDLPANAKILAYSDLYPQAFRIGSAVGIQFHFEVDEPLIQTWIKQYSADLIAEKIRPESILPAPYELEELLARCRHIYNNFARVLQK